MQDRPYSVLDAPLPKDSPMLGVGPVRRRLEDGTFDVRALEQVVPPDVDGAIWQLRFSVHHGDDVLEATVHSVSTERSVVQAHLDLGLLEGRDAEALLASAHAVGVRVHLDPDAPLGDYHLQLRLLHHVVPEALGVVDASACVVRPRGWLAEAATSSVPPHPTTLWCVHAVHEGDVVWMHTHGLDRCGRIELDMLGVPAEHVGLLGQLLNAAAGRLLDAEVDAWPEDEEVVVGHGMPLVWLPVGDALANVGRQPVGGADDREDGVHAGERGVLLVKEPGKLWGHSYRSPATYLPILEDNPLLYVSDMETARREALAQERYPRFTALFEATKGIELFRFLVKLGLETTEGGREHIWFDFHKPVSGDRIDATCLNRPYDVPSVSEGMRGWFDRALMTDFSVLSPLGQLGPDQIALLERLVADRDALDEMLAGFQGDA